ncbi:hypothetical protein F5X97DRAFT_51795 [Nemania serpens]|nr:hypothetical protein F5X97DRAFT_51795 [Nemania serpens]
MRNPSRYLLGVIEIPRCIYFLPAIQHFAARLLYNRPCLLLAWLSSALCTWPCTCMCVRSPVHMGLNKYERRALGFGSTRTTHLPSLRPNAIPNATTNIVLRQQKARRNKQTPSWHTNMKVSEA